MEKHSGLEPRGRPILEILTGAACLAAVVGFLWIVKEAKDQKLEPGQHFVRIEDPIRTDLQRAIDAGAPDPGAKIKPISIGQMLALDRPDELSHLDTDFHGVRHGEFEHSIWKLDVEVESIILREDNDYYLVLQQDGHRVCAELPDPDLCRESKFYPQIKRVRELLEQEFAPSRVPKNIGKKATISGLGLFGKPRRGLTKSNGARIYPLLSITWK